MASREVTNTRRETMTDAVGQSMTRSTKPGDAGVLMTVVSVASDLTEQGLKGSLGIVRTVRSEVFRATHGAVDWVESLQQVPFKVVRAAVETADKLSSDVIDGAESVAMSVTKVIRGSGQAAGEMVSRTTESIVGAGNRTIHAA
jgi:hypothetical protein